VPGKREVAKPRSLSQTDVLLTDAESAYNQLPNVTKVATYFVSVDQQQRTTWHPAKFSPWHNMCIAVIFYLLIFVLIWAISSDEHLLFFLVARHCVLYRVFIIQFMLSCTAD